MVYRKRSSVKSRRRSSTRKSRAPKRSRNCSYGVLARPVRDKQTGKMRYCKLPKTRVRKSRHCPAGELARPVLDTHTGKMRYCKLSEEDKKVRASQRRRRYSRSRKARKSRARKSRARKSRARKSRK